MEGAGPGLTRSFVLCGSTFSIPCELVEDLDPVIRAFPAMFPGTSGDIASRLLKQAEPMLDGRGLLPDDAWSRLSTDKRRQIVVDMSVLLCHGISSVGIPASPA